MLKEPPLPAVSSDELDFGAECRESVRRLSIDSVVICQGKTIFDDYSNRIVSKGKCIAFESINNIYSLETPVTDSCLLLLLWPCRGKKKDIETGHVLGSGTFGTVRELKKLLKRSSTTSSTLISSESLNSSSHSGASKDESTSAQTKEDIVAPSSSLYAIKQLRHDLSSSKRRNGSIDLVVEAQLLTSLSHRNIVSLEGIGENPGSKGFFIIIERLERTLTQEMKA
jgi:Protein kinase domain.